MKYCDTCVHYLFKNNKHLCKAFGIIHFNEYINNKDLKYYATEYARSHSYLCNIDANLYINKNKSIKLDYNNNFNKRMNKFK